MTDWLYALTLVLTAVGYFCAGYLMGWRFRMRLKGSGKSIKRRHKPEITPMGMQHE